MEVPNKNVYINLCNTRGQRRRKVGCVRTCFFLFRTKISDLGKKWKYSLTRVFSAGRFLWKTADHLRQNGAGGPSIVFVDVFRKPTNTDCCPWNFCRAMRGTSIYQFSPQLSSVKVVILEEQRAVMFWGQSYEES